MFVSPLMRVCSSVSVSCPMVISVQHRIKISLKCGKTTGLTFYFRRTLHAFILVRYIVYMYFANMNTILREQCITMISTLHRHCVTVTLERQMFTSPHCNKLSLSLQQSLIITVYETLDCYSLVSLQPLIKSPASP